MRERVVRVREAQGKRFLGRAIRTNSGMGAALIREHCALDGTGRQLLFAAVERLGLSARAHHRILNVARTLADLEEEGRIAPRHVAEAIQYRMLDRSAPVEALGALW
jgi:magnesium chelatase family protein